MQPQSVKVETTAFEKVLYERWPAVSDASRRLQAAMGILPGTKVIGHDVVAVWEMPVPPAFIRMDDGFSSSEAAGLGGDNNSVAGDWESTVEAESGIDDTELDIPKVIVQPPWAGPGPALRPPALSMAASLQKRKRSIAAPEAADSESTKATQDPRY